MSTTPVHDAFGLTRAAYFVMPRVMLEAMPVEWQERFVALFDEFSSSPVDWVEVQYGDDERQTIITRHSDEPSRRKETT